LALGDIAWQAEQRRLIPRQMQQLRTTLEAKYNVTPMDAGLFAYIELDKDMAVKEHERLCTNGVLTRLFLEQGALRFGLTCTNNVHIA
jgi:hypothetical protein